MIDILWFSHNLNIRVVYQKNHKKIHNREEERQILKIDFENGDTPEKLKKEYLDMYKGNSVWSNKHY